MGKLLDYLKATAGERNTRNALGVWRQKVSAVIDGAGLGSPIYITTQRTDTALEVSSPGTDLILQFVANGEGLLYAPLVGEYTLAPDSTYELEFFGQFETFADPAASVVVEWVNGVNAPLVAATEAQYLAVNGTLDASSKPVAKAIYKTGPTAEVAKLRATQTPSGGAYLSVDSYAIVRKIG